MTAAPALVMGGVSKRYGTREVLSGVDLHADYGQIHGLLGPNGAGKTTLMRLLLGLAARDGGFVRVFGRDIDWMGAALPDGLAGSIETPAFYPYLSGRRQLELLARLDGLGARQGHLRAGEALERTGLTAQAGVAVGAYSAGMRQRLALAAALLRRPRLLVLDEPTNALDPGNAELVRGLVRQLAHDGVAVVLSSHDMGEVERLCEVVTALDHGRVVFSGTVAALRRVAPQDAYLLRTSDDAQAAVIATAMNTVRMTTGAEGGFEVSATLDALDAYVVALGRAGVAVRALEPRQRSLEAWFLETVGQRRSESTSGATRS
jgi:ABC-2 type transport system ATP-binding protein